MNPQTLRISPQPKNFCRRLASAAFAGFLSLLCAAGPSASAQTEARWKAHDMSRPRPRVVAPANKLPVPPPSDAKVLFDGGGLSKWRSAGGGPAKWVVKDGYMESVAGSGYIVSRDTFGDVQLHVEWAAPTPAEGKGQGRGNSGVFLMGMYEIQVLDSYKNVTYADGQASAIYGQSPPLVNASRPPGEWQSYDIIFRRPRFKPDGSLLSPARATVFHNGVLVQDNEELWGPTSWLQHRPYKSHPTRLPLSLQDHGNPVRFRNIWVRELRESKRPGPGKPDDRPAVVLTSAELERYTGEYEVEPLGIAEIFQEDGRLYARFFGPNRVELVAHSEKEFSLRWTAADLVFDLNEEGKPEAFTFSIGTADLHGKKVK